MQKIKTLIIPFLVSGVLIATSCKKNDILPENINEVQASTESSEENNSLKSIPLINGRLAFKDTASFWTTVRYFKNSKAGTLKKWDRENNITSMQETYQSINEKVAERDSRNDEYIPSNDELSVSERVERGTILLIPDPIFASILNMEGEYQVGEKIYRVTQRKVYSVDAAKEMILRKNDLENPALEVTDVKYSLPGSQKINSANRTGHFTMWYTLPQDKDVNGNSIPQTWNGRPTRLLASQWNVVWGLYASHGMKSQFEYKTRFGGWVDNDCTEIYVKGESAIIRPNDHSRTRIYVSNEDVKHDDDVVEATLQVHASAEFMEIVWSHSTHRAIYKGATVQIIL